VWRGRGPPARRWADWARCPGPRVKSRLAEAPPMAGSAATAAPAGRGNKMPLLAGVAVLALVAAGAGVMLTQGNDGIAPVAQDSAPNQPIAAQVARAPATPTVAAPTETAFSSAVNVTPAQPEIAEIDSPQAVSDNIAVSSVTEAVAPPPSPSPEEVAAEAARVAEQTARAERDAYIASLPDTLRQPDPADPRSLAAETLQTLAEARSEARAYERAQLARIRPVLRPTGTPQRTPRPADAPTTALVAKVLESASATPRAISSSGLAPQIAEAGHNVTLAMAQPGWDAAAPVAAIAITGAPIEEDAVTSTWSVALPLGDLRADPQGSMMIRSVNGTVIDSLEAFEAHLVKLGLTGAADEVSLQLGLGRPGAAPGVEQTLTLPVIKRTRLWNGLELRSERDGDQWVTVVTALPETGSTDLRVGDVLVADMNGGQRLQSADAAQDLLEAATLRGISTISFAVTRNGDNEIVSLTLPPRT
ncbi:MAG: hypothetical protein AAFQ50_10780, partial [Pseudomonadota bacterium]